MTAERYDASPPWPRETATIACDRCDAAPGEPCHMVRCNGACSAKKCDDNPHDHELEIACWHQARLRGARDRKR